MPGLSQEIIDSFGFRRFAVPSGSSCDQFFQRPVHDDDGTRYYVNLKCWDNSAYPGGGIRWQIKTRLYMLDSDKSFLEATFFNISGAEDIERALKTLEEYYAKLGCEHASDD